MKEFKLSDKKELKKYGMSYVYPEKDVKEFIRLCLEEPTMILVEGSKGIFVDIDKIKRLAGDLYSYNQKEVKQSGNKSR